MFSTVGADAFSLTSEYGETGNGETTKPDVMQLTVSSIDARKRGERVAS